MRNFVFAALVMSVAACGGGGGKSSADELGRAVASALAAKDRDGVIKLMASTDAAVDACPALAGERAEIERKRAKAEGKIIEAFAKCGELDWSKFEIASVEGGKADDPIEGCPDLIEAKDIKVLGKLDGKDVKITLDDPIILKGKYYLFDRIKCSGGGAAHPLVAITRAMADEACKCTDSACATKITEEFSKASMEAAKSSDAGTEEDAKAIMADSKRMTDCITKLSTPQ